MGCKGIKKSREAWPRRLRRKPLRELALYRLGDRMNQAALGESLDDLIEPFRQNREEMPDPCIGVARVLIVLGGFLMNQTCPSTGVLRPSQVAVSEPQAFCRRFQMPALVIIRVPIQNAGPKASPQRTQPRPAAQITAV